MKYKVGDKVSFYDVSQRKKVNAEIEGFVKKSNKKSRVITLAYGYNKSGQIMYRIVANEAK